MNPPLNNIACIAKADSGTSNHFWREQDQGVLSNIGHENGPSVKLPNATTINDTKVGYIPLSTHLSKKAQKTRILKDLKSSSLISIGQLADDGCTTVIRDSTLIVKKNNKIILKGKRNVRDNLYDIPIYQPHPNPKTTISSDNYLQPQLHSIYKKTALLKKQICSLKSGLISSTPKKKQMPYHCNHISHKCLDTLIQTEKHKDQKINVILRKQQTHSDLAEFLHGCACSPVTSTFITAVNNNQFMSWPGLTTKLIKKHLPPNRATAKSHLHQESQHLQSTKPHDTDMYLKNIKRNIARLKNSVSNNQSLKGLLANDIAADAFPLSPTPNTKTSDVLYTLIESSPKGIGYIDLTGRFPYKSARGNQYFVIAYHYDANAIYVKPIKNRESKSITTAWQFINKKFIKQE